MTAEEELSQSPELSSSIQKGTTASYIVKTIKESPGNFKSALETPGIVKPLNENKLTQILVEQIDIVLRKSGVSIFVQNQYSDIFLGSKGIPDFYFYKGEEGRTNEPLFIVEAKRLTTTFPIERKKEYVIGATDNGGIERFKLGIHGKGHSECGIVGYIEEEDADYWLKTINKWIEDLAKDDAFWNTDEKISEEEKRYRRGSENTGGFFVYF